MTYIQRWWRWSDGQGEGDGGGGSVEVEEVLLVVDTEAGVGPHQQVRLQEGSCKYIQSKI